MLPPFLAGSHCAGAFVFGFLLCFHFFVLTNAPRSSLLHIQGSAVLSDFLNDSTPDVQKVLSTDVAASVLCSGGLNLV